MARRDAEEFICRAAQLPRPRLGRQAVAAAVDRVVRCVKEALAAVFEKAGRAHASARSFNNHWGAPLTLARMTADTQRPVFRQTEATDPSADLDSL